MNGEVTVTEDRLRALEVAFADLRATVTTKLDALIDATAKVGSDHENRLRAVEARPVPDPELDGRVTALERKVWTAAGWLACAALVLNLAVTIGMAVFFR